MNRANISCTHIPTSHDIVEFLKERIGTKPYVFVHGGGVNLPEEYYTPQLLAAILEKFGDCPELHIKI